jgi:uncharacterized lipoprotein YddW (UPF0748 family)
MWVVAGVLALLPAGRVGAALLEIDAFDYATADESQAAWVAMEGSPLAQVAEGGPWGAERLTVLPCDFSAPARTRCLWHHTVALDLTPFPVLALRLYCPEPSPVSWFTIYFLSGDGCYVGGAALANTGWNELVFQRHEFGVEGTPAGWNRIDGIRLSPWRGDQTDTVLYADRLWAFGPEVRIVRGTLTEQTYGIDIDPYCALFTEWLDLYDVPYALTTDEGVEQGALDGGQLAIFPYNPAISSRELMETASFTSAGGALMAFYNIDQRVTDLMGVTQLAWNGTDVRAMVFEPSSIPGLPDRVPQASWNFMEVAPSAPETKVLARWEDCNGVPLEFPALLDGPQGAYLSHVLLRDGAIFKQQALLAIILHHVPELGPTVAAAALARMGRIALYETFDEAYASIAAMGPGSLHTVETAAELAVALDAKTTAEQAWTLGAYIDVLSSAAEANAALVRAYAWCQLPRADEFRAFTSHNGTGVWPGDWGRSAALLAGNGFNAVVPNMLWGGLAHYPSNLLPRSETFDTYGDQIAQCLDACAPYGLAVHVWKVNWNLFGAPPEFLSQMRAEGRTQKDVSGRDVDWLCPSHPLNRDLERESMLEVVTWYDVAGLLFDYIRYPNDTCCYCDGCRARFETYRGAPVSNWPLDCYSGALHDEYRDWRALQITQLVQEVHDAAKALKPEILISAAVYPTYPDCREEVGQDWVSWVDRGYLDLVMPMNYTDSPSAFADLLTHQLAYVGGRIPVCPCIGASSPGLPVDQVIVQALETRAQATGGFTVFDLDITAATEILPWLTDPGATSSVFPALPSSLDDVTRILGAPYPNPAPGWMRFDVVLPQELQIRARIIDVSGRVVATPIDRMLPAGAHRFTWSPPAQAVPSGIYTVRLEAMGLTETRRLVWVR